ncbi:hypothetical protein F4821DRAFT_233209 [Hypoxylon rubiginosum]|uniref:Uncharacterized protein n=1 Tax=Hypoxylon rubiginosum TaxID=110542 RepID=A0ACC0D7H1_9PEZI|nr:hypothetical protein F4821DRAFT_233209 [Hypoxylon rubiginosum]
MSHFISALAGTASQGSASTSGDGVDSTDAPGDEPTTGAPESIKELPRDDALISSPNERTKEILSEAGRNASQGKSQKLEDEFNGAGAEGSKTSDSDSPEPADVSKEAEGTTNAAQEQDGDAKPVNITGEPDTANISKDAQVDVSHGKEKTNGFARVASDGSGRKANTVDSNKPSDNTQVADNMGKPAHIERRIEIPLPRPEKVVSSPPEPNKPDTDNITNGLRSTDDLPGTEDLPSTNGLPGLPDDPPEEILDPSVHSPSSNISPIPKIPKVAPIGIAPPPDLLDLAHGLGGNTVDDVGNIVDASGEVLGHATGDLPAMVGRQVADNGEIHGEDGEIVGYVSENFTDPPPADIPENVLGGLKIDHQGNILDASGNIIGRFNEKAGENGALAPFLNRKKSSNPRAESKPQEEKPPKVNAQTGGSPSDLFLDVKSTADGIQLIIRIPTMFGKQPQD